jgi:AraC-like DNA-binding protein
VLITDGLGEMLRGAVLLTGVRDFLTNGFSAARLFSAIAKVARRHGTPVPSPSNIAIMKCVFVALDDHVGHGPTLGELARRAQMSPSHFSRTSHAVAGIPLRTYVQERRLKRAHALLMASKLSLTEAALESGFYDLPHFDKAFRRRLGVSPRVFRARQRIDVRRARE